MRKTIIGKRFYILIVLMLVTVGMLTLTNKIVTDEHITLRNTIETYAPKTSALQPAPPLTISGDTGWTAGFASQWVNGSGTWASPYTIKNYAINGTSGQPCIYILNTTKPFRILNCITNTSGSSGDVAGIRLENASNGWVENNTCLDQNPGDNGPSGIFLRWTNNDTIINNTCPSNSVGIALEGSGNITIQANLCQNNGFGIQLSNGCQNNTIMGDNCTDSGNTGIYFLSSNNNTIMGCNCTGNSNDGILTDISLICNNITVTNCLCTGNGNAGIEIDAGSNDTVSANNCSANQGGIFLQGSYGAIVSNFCGTNSLYDGILGSGSHLNLTGNNCTMNGEHGIYLFAVDTCMVTANNCTHNQQWGLYFEGSSTVTASGNNCSRNGGGIGIESTSNHDIISQNWIQKNAGNPISDNGSSDTIGVNYILLFAVAAFSTNPTAITVGQSVQFTDATTNGKTPYKYQWNYGDGSTNDTTQNPTHTFASGGTFTVTLTITDAEGDISIHQTTFTILWPKLVGAFTACASAINVGDSILFTDTSTGGKIPYSYQWNFGDGTANATTQNPTHQFTTAGTFTVTLTVTDANGNVSVLHQTVTVNGLGWTTIFIMIAVVAVLGVLAIVLIYRARQKARSTT